MLRTAGVVKTLRDLGYDVEDRGDLAIVDPPAHAAPPEGKANRFAEVAAWAQAAGPRNLCGRSRWADADRARRRSQSRDGFDRRRRPPRRRGGARTLRPVARRPFGLQHAADLAVREYARHVARDAVPGAGTRGRVWRPSRTDSSIPRGSTCSASGRSTQANGGCCKNRGVDVVDMRRLDEDGFALSIRRIIDRVRARNGLLHVSLDVDFLDPAIAPGVGTAVSGRGHLSRGASGHGAFVRIRSFALARSRRAQSVPRRARAKARSCWST